MPKISAIQRLFAPSNFETAPDIPVETMDYHGFRRGFTYLNSFGPPLCRWGVPVSSSQEESAAKGRILGGFWLGRSRRPWAESSIGRCTFSHERRLFCRGFSNDFPPWVDGLSWDCKHLPWTAKISASWRVSPAQSRVPRQNGTQRRQVDDGCAAEKLCRLENR